MLQQFYGTASLMNLERLIILCNLKHYWGTANAIYAGSCSVDLFAAMSKLCFLICLFYCLY